MKGTQLIPVLSITGSDGTGGSGIQADIKTCEKLGAYSVTVVSAVTVQDTRGIQSVLPIPSSTVEAQLSSVMADMCPKAVKVGMMCDCDCVNVIAEKLHNHGHIVLDAAFISSRGERMADDDVVESICRKLMPECELVVMSKSEAEMLTSSVLESHDALLVAVNELCRMCSVSYMLVHGKEADLFVDYAESGHHYYMLPDFSNCNTHGLSGTLSTAIAAYLAQGHSVCESVALAYKYIQTLVVYSVSSPYGHQASLLGHKHNQSRAEENTLTITPRQQEIYNDFMQLIVNSIREQHDVSFYADRLNITPRYLSQITMVVARKSPKQILVEQLVTAAERLLLTSSMTIQQVAFACGFSSATQFSKFFRHIKGHSPSEVRRTL